MSSNPAIPSIEDILFDDAFAAPSQSVAVPAQPVSTPPTSVPTAPPTNTVPQVPIAPEFFLETPTGSRYRSKDEVVNGIAEKDGTIEYLRNFAMNTMGVDPLKVRNGLPQAPQAPKTYLEDPAQYVKDLSDAYESQNSKAYAEVQNRLVQENLNTVLAPVAPLVAKLLREEAIETVVAKIPDFREFYKSDGYKTVLDENPTLANAVRIAESNPDMKDQLPDLYSMARKLAVAKTNDTLLEAAKAQNPAAPQAVRPTATPGNPVPSNPAIDTSNWKTDPAARKAYLENARAKGLGNFDISSVIPSR